MLGRIIICGTCRGKGEIEDVCEYCNGKGEIPYEEDCISSGPEI